MTGLEQGALWITWFNQACAPCKHSIGQWIVPLQAGLNCYAIY